MSTEQNPTETPKETQPGDIEASSEACASQAGDAQVTEPCHSDEDIQNRLDEAAELKLEGNEEFRVQHWNDALAIYRRALGRLPKRRSLASTANAETRLEHAGVEAGDDSPEQTPPMKADLSPKEDDDDIAIPSALEQKCSKARAVLNANIAACYVKLGEHKESVAACTEALLDDPDYVKALQRRAASNERIDTWSSLTSARDDYTKLLGILPSNSAELSETRRRLQALTPRVEAAQKRETGEMFNQLKGLGNSILGNFGLSTDNFQFVPNGQGGYSMNFVR